MVEFSLDEIFLGIFDSNFPGPVVYLNPYIFNVERASADAPGGSMKYQLTYLNIRLFKCGYRIVTDDDDDDDDDDDYIATDDDANDVNAVDDNQHQEPRLLHHRFTHPQPATFRNEAPPEAGASHLW